MSRTVKQEDSSLAGMLVKIEIDSNAWAKKSPMEKLALLLKETGKNSEKLVSAASEFIAGFAGLIRDNTENPVVREYLGLAETGFGLVKATTVMNNIFISAHREIHSPYDTIAAFMGAGKGIDMISDSMEGTAGICETFLSLTDAEQKKYGLRFIKIHKEDEDMGVGPDQGPSVFYVDAEWTLLGKKYHIGFEVGYYDSKHKGDRLSDDGGYSYINFCMPGEGGSYSALYEIPAKIYGIYIDRIDISKNIIRVKNGTMYVEPRIKVDFDVRNFDLYDETGKPIRTMESESAFIRRVLDHDGRRGYIVQGDQGTGKTISVNRLLMDFPDVPVFWIMPDSIADRRSMDNVFRVLNMFPGSFFIFDDFDGNNFSEKNDMTGAFINYIDETNSPKYRGITILIINDPQKLHSTIKLRPGRIDDIIYVKNPDTAESVCDVVEQSFKHLGETKPEWASASNPEFAGVCELVFGARLTHAYISGVITDMVKYSHDEMSVDRFRELVSRRISSIKYAKMMALEDGHIVEVKPEKIVRSGTINSEVSNEQENGMIVPM